MKKKKKKGRLLFLFLYWWNRNVLEHECLKSAASESVVFCNLRELHALIVKFCILNIFILYG